MVAFLKTTTFYVKTNVVPVGRFMEQIGALWNKLGYFLFQHPVTLASLLPISQISLDALQWAKTPTPTFLGTFLLTTTSHASVMHVCVDQSNLFIHLLPNFEHYL